MGELIDNVATLIQTNPWLAFVAVFIGGVLTACAPCVLAMIPLMMSYVASATAGSENQRASVLRAFGYSVLFVLGLSLTFVALGMIAALAGRMYGEVSSVWNWIVVVVCVVMGLHLAGVLKFTIPMPIKVQPKVKGPVGAFLLGLLFGVVSAPCAAPILVVLLTYLAGSGASIAYGGGLLLMYALGHSVLILVAGTSMGLAQKILESKRMTRATDVMRRVSGIVIVLVGVYFAYKAII